MSISSVVLSLFVASAICTIGIVAQWTGSIVQSLQNSGVIRQSPYYNPCTNVNCGWNSYCEVIAIGGGSSVRTYRCRAYTTSSSAALPVCYDRVEIRVPAGTSNSNTGTIVPVLRAACRNECNSNRNCGRNQICCTRGCDRICYAPRTSVVDYTG